MSGDNLFDKAKYLRHCRLLRKAFKDFPFSSMVINWKDVIKTVVFHSFFMLLEIFSL